MTKTNNKINIYSMFRSISGEMGVIPQGMVTLFIRTGLCNLHCKYCDAEKALIRENCSAINIDILSDFLVRGLDDLVFPGNVIITGGEPLLQEKLVNVLVERLYEDCDNEPVIQIETNGSLLPKHIQHVDCWVVDYKMPSSGMYERMMPIEKMIEGFYGRGKIFLKFVVGNEEEIRFAIRKIHEVEDFLYETDGMDSDVVYGLSPVVTGNAELDIVLGRVIANIMLEEELPEHQMFINAINILLNLQLHKIINRSAEEEEDALISNLFDINGSSDVESALKGILDNAPPKGKRSFE